MLMKLYIFAMVMEGKMRIGTSYSSKGEPI